MEYFIAWWNLENLFDVANSTDRPEWLQKKLNSELVSWNHTFNRSITHYAPGLKDSSKVQSKRSQKPYLYNLMWPLQKDKSGMHYYDSWGMLDQILVNRPLLRKESQLQLVSDSCQIFKTSDMLKSGKPRRFSRPSAGGSFDPSGFSDHLPLTVQLVES